MANEIVSYLKSLLPHFEKDQLLSDLRITETELQATVIPSYAAAASFFSQDGFKSDENIAIEKEIKGLLKKTTYGRFPTFLSSFHIALGKIEINTGIVINEINKEIGRDIVTEGVSAKKVVLMRIAERISFISRYSLDVLNLIYLNEAVATGASVQNIGMSKAEMKKAKDSIYNLSKLIDAYGIDQKEFEKHIDKTPDLLLSKINNDSVEGTFSDEEIDSINPSLTSGFAGNPIYHIRLAIAEWQVNRYKANAEKKKILELRLLHLTMLKEKNGTNPKIEKEIEYNQARVARIDRYLTEVEEDLEIAN